MCCEMASKSLRVLCDPERCNDCLIDKPDSEEVGRLDDEPDNDEEGRGGRNRTGDLGACLR